MLLVGKFELNHCKFLKLIKRGSRRGGGLYIFLYVFFTN